MNLSEAFTQRRSVRKFTNQPVPEPLIRTIIEAAICAPSASNRQPWRFMVSEDPAVRQRLSGCVKEALAETNDAIQPGFEKEYQAYSRHFLDFEHAPVLVFAFYKAEATMASLLRGSTLAQMRMSELEMNGALISVSMAVQNLLLAATDQGLGTCVMTGPLIAEKAFDEVLGVPAGWKILCMVCVGYADEVPGLIRKKTVTQVMIPARTGANHGTG